MLYDGGAYRAHRLRREVVAILPRPLNGCVPVEVEFLEPRHHVARHQFVGSFGRLPVGPIVRERQEASEAAGLRMQALDLRDAIVRRANHREARFYHRLNGIAAVGSQRQIGYLAEVVNPLVQAEADVGAGLLARFGNVYRTNQAPSVAVHGFAKLARPLLADSPGRPQRAE